MNALLLGNTASTYCAHLLFISWSEALFVLVVLVLVVATVYACTRFTKGPASKAALRDRLLLLQSKFAQASAVNPGTERAEMEKLQNHLKTTISGDVISADGELRLLFGDICYYI